MATEPPLEHPDAKNARSPSLTWRILFIDREENLEKLKNVSLDAGYVVIGATDVAEAWSFLQGLDHVDVIVCAAYLQNESMLDFVHRIRCSNRGEVAIAILSLDPTVTAARLDRSTRNAAMVIGADAYVVMPTFDAAELIRQLQALRPDVPMLRLDDSQGAERQKAAERLRVGK